METGSSTYIHTHQLTDRLGQYDPKTCHLMLQTLPGLQAFAVFNPELNQYHALASLQPAQEEETDTLQQLIAWVRDEKHLQQPYKAFKIGLHTRKQTLVPRALFDISQAARYLEPLVDLPDNFKVYYDYVPALMGYHVYALPQKEVQELKSLFKQPLIYHSYTPVIQLLLTLNRSQKGTRLLLFMHSSQLIITVLQNGKLLLFNSYPVQEVEDGVYFSLAVCEQLGLNTADIETHYYGVAGDTEAALLKDYLPKLEAGDRPPLYHYNDILDSVPNHNYYELFALNVCE